RMLKLPAEVRNRKLEDYIKYSAGNPISQVRSFNQMQQFLTDRELILGVDTLKEFALTRLEQRLFELTMPQLEEQFNAKILTNPADIKILIQAQSDIESQKDPEKIKIIDQLS